MGEVLPFAAVFVLQDVCEMAADGETCGGVCRRIFHRLPLVRAHQTARNGAAVFRDDIGDAVFLGNLEGKYAGIVHTVGVNQVGQPVFADVVFESFQTRTHPADAVDVDERKAGEEIHAVPCIDVQTALPI